VSATATRALSIVINASLAITQPVISIIT
jgi:hypothetical protein